MKRPKELKIFRNEIKKMNENQKKMTETLRNRAYGKFSVIQKISFLVAFKQQWKKMISKKRSKYSDDKLIAYLVRQGFDYQRARAAVLGTD